MILVDGSIEVTKNLDIHAVGGNVHDETLNELARKNRRNVRHFADLEAISSTSHLGGCMRTDEAFKVDEAVTLHVLPLLEIFETATSNTCPRCSFALPNCFCASLKDRNPDMSGIPRLSM